MNADDTGTAKVWHELQLALPDLHWSSLRKTHGAFHHVAILGPDVVRVASGAGHEERARRELANLTTAASLALPFAVPAPRGDVVTRPDWSAQVIGVAQGKATPELEWRRIREQVGAVIEALHAAPIPAGGWLRPTRDWCGGDTWPEVVDRAAQAMPAWVRRSAARVVTDVLRAQAAEAPCFVHGDFGVHNLLFTGATVSALIDFDNACVGDPAIDFAPLIGMFGGAAVAEITDAETLERARIHRASLALQVAAAAHLIGDAKLRDHALGNFASRVHAGTLYEPTSARQCT